MLGTLNASTDATDSTDLRTSPITPPQYYHLLFTSTTTTTTPEAAAAAASAAVDPNADNATAAVDSFADDEDMLLYELGLYGLGLDS